MEAVISINKAPFLLAGVRFLHYHSNKPFFKRAFITKLPYQVLTVTHVEYCLTKPYFDQRAFKLWNEHDNALLPPF